MGIIAGSNMTTPLTTTRFIEAVKSLYDDTPEGCRYWVQKTIAAMIRDMPRDVSRKDLLSALQEEVWFYE